MKFGLKALLVLIIFLMIKKDHYNCHRLTSDICVTKTNILILIFITSKSIY